VDFSFFLLFLLIYHKVLINKGGIIMSIGIVDEPDYKKMYDEFKEYLISINNDYHEEPFDNLDCILTTEEGFLVEYVSMNNIKNFSPILFVRGINNTIPISFNHLLRLLSEHKLIYDNHSFKK